MAIERNICGFEIADPGEFNYQLAIPATHFISGTSPRTGTYCYRVNAGTLAGTGYFTFFPVGAVIGTSGTVTSGNKKRARARVYVRINSQSFSFPTSAGHIWGFGQDLGTCGMWVDGNRNFGVRVGSGTIVLSTGILALNTWYACTLDVLLDVSANTLVTATLTITDDSTVPTFSETIQATGNIGASDALDVVGMGEVRQGTFGISGSYDFDDFVYMGTSDADAVNPIVLPTNTHIALVPPTGVVLNQWETGTYTNVDEYPVNTADTMSSVLGTGTEVEFSHASGILLGFGGIQAMKLYVNSKVASGTGNVDMMLGGVATSRTLTGSYPGSASSNPNGGVQFLDLTNKQFNAISFGVKKQNGTQQTFIANIGMEVLYSVAGYGAGNQIRGETQIKTGSIFDAQIASAAGIQRSKIRGLTDGPMPFFVPEDPIIDDWHIPGPPGPSGVSARVPVTPIFFDTEVGGGDDGMVIPGPAGAAGTGGGGGSTTMIIGGGLVPIAQIICSGSQTTVDFTSIPQTFTALRLIWRSEDTATGTVGIGIRVRLNGDSTSGNYSTAQRIGSQGGVAFASGAAPTSGGAQVGFHSTAGSTNYVGQGEVVFSDYANAALYKSFVGAVIASSSSGDIVATLGSWWFSTAAINRITVTTDGTAFRDGSIFTLYGMSATASLIPAHGTVLLAAQALSSAAQADFVSRNVGSLTGAIFQSDYDEYVIEILGLVPATDNVDLLMRCSTDGGANFDSGTNYGKQIRADNASFNTVAGADTGLTSITLAGNLDTTTPQGSLSATVRAYLPLNTSLYKVFTVQGSYHNNDGHYYSFIGEGRYLSTTAVNALRFVLSSGNIASAAIRIYGVVKDATYPVTTIQTGTHATRPSAGNQGRIYLPNDGYSIGRDSGSAWETWGPVSALTLPPTGVWSWRNQGSSTITESKDSLQLLGAGTGSAFNGVARVKTAPATPFTITARLIPPAVTKLFLGYGIGLRQNGAGTGTGRLHTFWWCLGNAAGADAGGILRVEKWTSETVFSASYLEVRAIKPPEWFRITDNGTNIISSTSSDGQTWQQVHSIARTDFLLQGADQVGFLTLTSNSVTPNFDVPVNVISWKET